MKAESEHKTYSWWLDKFFQYFLLCVCWFVSIYYKTVVNLHYCTSNIAMYSKADFFLKATFYVVGERSLNRKLYFHIFCVGIIINTVILISSCQLSSENSNKTNLGELSHWKCLSRKQNAVKCRKGLSCKSQWLWQAGFWEN